MFNYSHNTGLSKNFISESELVPIINRMESLNSTIIPEGSCKGVDVNYTEMYEWFVENVLVRLRKYTKRSDLELIFGFLGDVTQSFKIHQDIKTIPKKEKNPNGKQFASFLIPISVDYDPNKCFLNSTMVFDKHILKEPTEPKSWHYKVAGTNPQYENKKYGLIDHRHFNLIGEHTWGRGDLIWWNSNYWHCGLDNNAIGIETKQMLVIHTYV